jgi:glycosyltransferase involved in cell wall biosynthesis
MRQHLKGLWQYLDRKLVEPFIVCPFEEGKNFSRENPEFTIFPLDIRQGINPWHDWQVAITLPRLAKAWDVEIIHAHGYKAGLLSLWAGLHNYRRYRLVCTFHNPLPNHSDILKNWVTLTSARAIGRIVDHLIVISRFIEMDTIKRLHLPEGKVTCIYNGIDPVVAHELFDTGELKREWGVPEGRPLIGTIARLIPQKGIQYLIEAAALLKNEAFDFRMLIVGDGPFRQQLEELAVGVGVRENLLFTGFRRDIPEIFAMIDLFVLPTLEEGMSIAVLEAMRAGKPVIASRVGGVPEIVTKETGILIRPADPKALAAAIQQLWSDAETRKRMGDAGREQVTNDFTLNKMAEKHYYLYKQLIK